MGIAYYKSFDNDAVYACVGPMACEALFRLREPPVGDRSWEFLVPDSPAWDSTHQSIYRNPRVEAVKPEDVVSLPPLPDIPRGPFPSWKEHFLPKHPVRASTFPRVAALFEAGTREAVTVFVVLFEDTYETVLGDGEFHYLRKVFLTREDAQRYVDQTATESERLHLRSMTLGLDHATFVFPEFDPQLFDHYEAEEVLRALEASVRGKER